MIKALFSDTALAVLKGVLLAAVPDKYDWIPSTVIAVVSVVDEVEDVVGLTGPQKMDAVVRLVREALDGADDIPGWASLDEEVRDGFIHGLAETAVFVGRAINEGGLPDKAHRVRFADGVRALVLAALDLADAFDGKPPRAIDALTDARVRSAALAKALNVRA